MANALYPSYKQLAATTGLNLSSIDIRVILGDGADYTYNSAHDFLNDVAAASRVATSGALASQSVTNGVLDAADKTLTAVTGDVSEFLLLYYHTGNEATASLIAYIDTSITGIPFTPNGGDVVIQWNASGIFAI